MANENNEKVGLNDVNFLGLGEEPTDKEEIIEEEEIEQEQGEEETPDLEAEENETPESETEDGETSAEDEDDTPDEDIENEEEEGEDEPSIFETAAESVGIDVNEDDFGDIDFSDPTTDDLSKFIEKSARQLSKKQLDATFEEYPEAEAFIEYSKNGGDPRQYMETMHPQFDYNEVSFDEHVAGDEANQEQIVRNHLAAQDTPKEEIDEMIEDFRNGGILQNQAKRSLNKLQQLQEQQQQQLIEQQKEAKQERIEQQQQQKQKIENIIEDSESIKGMKLPSTDKDDLKSYLFEPIDEQGRSQAFVDGQQMDEEERIAIAYLKMKGFDFESLIGNEAETRNAKRIKESIRKGKKEKVSGSRNKKKRTTGKIQDIKPII